MAKKRTKKSTTKKSTTKKSVKRAIKPENVKHVEKLNEKLDKLNAKITEKKSGNKNDKIVANLLEVKAAKYFEKKIEDLENE